MLHLSALFHLNLAYSSIAEEQRPEVIRRCYWPLLRLAREYNLPLGIEATGYTLETAAAVDLPWLEELRRLTTEGRCEFIGSGYSQIIGPLVPAEVNAANLRLGHQVYERLLGFRPVLALVNEQAYSAGLIQHYLDAGYQAIMMEWDNPASCHPAWNPEWRYLPQFACGQHGEEVPLIWNNSIAFQKFQRYVQSDMELDEYVDYLSRHLSETRRALSVYGNDAEIFDFRPGRYHTEPVLREGSEWQRIGHLFGALLSDGRFRFIRPGEMLAFLDDPGAGNRLHLESAEQPIPVKKQGKYNVTRWAVTGRGDADINTTCWRIYDQLRENTDAGDDSWRELCYLWSSDFRTHVTEERWRRYRERLLSFAEQVGANAPSLAANRTWNVTGQGQSVAHVPGVKRQGRYLVVETKAVRVKLNCQRGLTIDGLWLGSFDGPPLCGTLPHGYYDDIAVGADWYTGHLVLEAPLQPKVTDLNPVEPSVTVLEQGDLLIEGVVATSLGPVTKRVLVSAVEPKLTLSYVCEWSDAPAGSFRVGNITLNPDAFDRATLMYRTHNGGKYDETFLLNGTTVDHGNAVSFLVSARHGIGITDGWVEVGDARRVLRIGIDKTAMALIGMVSYRAIGHSYFCRLALSAGEMDETRRPAGLPAEGEIRCQIQLTAAF
ncbi:MAG: glycoside hydrolase family 57 [Dehalococcoidia bacterium]